MKGPFEIALRITSFRGVSIGAEHYYGELRVQYKADVDGVTRLGHGCWEHAHQEIALTRILGADEAAQLRKKDGDTHYPQGGDETERFNSKDDVIAAAVAAFPLYYQPEDLLTYEDRRTDVVTALAGDKMEAFDAVAGNYKARSVWMQENGFTRDNP